MTTNHLHQLLFCCKELVLDVHQCWLRNGQAPAFHNARCFLEKKLLFPGFLPVFRILLPPPSDQYFSSTTHTSFLATYISSIATDHYAGFKTSILTSALFQNFSLCRVQSFLKYSFCRYGPASLYCFYYKLAHSGEGWTIELSYQDNRAVYLKHTVCPTSPLKKKKKRSRFTLVSYL